MLNLIESFKPSSIAGFSLSCIEGLMSNNSNTRPKATKMFWILVRVPPKVFIGLYNNKSDVTNDAKSPDVIVPLLISCVPTAKTIAIPTEAIEYISGDIHAERFTNDIAISNDLCT